MWSPHQDTRPWHCRPQGSSAQSFQLGTHLRDQLQLVERAAAPKNMTFIRQGISARGFVVATPCLKTTVSASLVQGRQLADRLVDSTPQSFARSSASDANWHTHRAREGVSKTVNNTGTGPTTFEPPNIACSSASTTHVTHVPCRNASGHLWLTPNSAKGSDSAATAQNSHEHSSVTSPLPATQVRIDRACHGLSPTDQRYGLCGGATSCGGRVSAHFLGA